jgi:hypothetical protein
LLISWRFPAATVLTVRPRLFKCVLLRIAGLLTRLLGRAAILLLAVTGLIAAGLA